ncbi:MAG TPA: alpha/beta hydrolase family protein [Fimbriimonas sp.]
MAFCELRYFSNALGLNTAANVILPNPDVPGPYHVMFLLHGLSDDHTIWARRTSIERYVEGMPLVVVMPNTHRGFYVDAVEGQAFGTAIGKELPEIVRHYFPVRPEGWSVTGLSMGGYGALRLALGNPGLFRSAVSHSGAVNFGNRKIEGDDDRAKEFGRILGPDPVGGPNDLYALVRSCSPMPALRIDCGVDDFLIEDNREFHRFLSGSGVLHEYDEYPGEHNWAYWDEHVQQALQFHRRNLGF